jgi:hypothetical protein
MKSLHHISNISHLPRVLSRAVIVMSILLTISNISLSQVPNLITVDLSDSPTSSTTVLAQRLSNSFPCGTEIPYPDGGTNYAPGTDVCITFELILHPMSAGISILFDGGATPTPATWGLNCEESVPVNEVFCLEPGELSYYLTYCKPGSGSTNTIRFESLPNPNIFYSGICTSICPDIIFVGEGFLDYSITSTETDPTLKDTYESYLSCYPNCDNITTSVNNLVSILPSGDYPDIVEYQINGTLTAYESPCIDNISSTQNFTIDLYDSVYYEINPSGPIYTCCEPESTINLVVDNVQGGFPFNDGAADYYDLLWYDKLDAEGNLLQTDQGTYSSLEVSSAGDYSIKILDNNENCDAKVINFKVQDQSTLPVELLEFTGVCKNDEVQLKWSCATEYNNDYFQVEKSLDGIHFREIAIIRAAGNSVTNTNYEFFDTETINKNAIYQLSQVDYNGEKHILQLTSAQCIDDETSLFIHKNPFQAVLHLSLMNSGTSPYEIQILDRQGITHYQTSFINVENIQIDLRFLPAGMYFLILKHEKDIIRRKIVKL